MMAGDAGGRDAGDAGRAEESEYDSSELIN
jgi:hypothetical protein